MVHQTGQQTPNVIQIVHTDATMDSGRSISKTSRGVIREHNSQNSDDAHSVFGKGFYEQPFASERSANSSVRRLQQEELQLDQNAALVGLNTAASLERGHDCTAVLRDVDPLNPLFSV